MKLQLILYYSAAKWNFVDFQSPSYSAIMMEYTTPPSYGSTVVNVGGIAQDGEIICAGSSNTAKHTEIKGDPENDWPEPGAARYSWTGETKDGKTVSAELEGSLGKRLDRIDVMAKVPSFVKTIVGGVVGTKPYIYQVRIVKTAVGYEIFRLTFQYSPHPRLTLKLTIDGIEKVEEGELFTEATFIT